MQIVIVLDVLLVADTNAIQEHVIGYVDREAEVIQTTTFIANPETKVNVMAVQDVLQTTVSGALKQLKPVEIVALQEHPVATKTNLLILKGMYILTRIKAVTQAETVVRGLVQAQTPYV